MLNVLTATRENELIGPGDARKAVDTALGVQPRRFTPYWQSLLESRIADAQRFTDHPALSEIQRQYFRDVIDGLRDEIATKEATIEASFREFEAGQASERAAKQAANDRLANRRRYLQRNNVKASDRGPGRAGQPVPSRVDQGATLDQAGPVDSTATAQVVKETVTGDHGPQPILAPSSPISSFSIPCPSYVFNLSKDDIAAYFSSLHSVQDIATEAGIFIPGSNYLRLGKKHRTQIYQGTNTVYDHEGRRAYNALQFCAYVTGQDIGELARETAQKMQDDAWGELVSSAHAGQPVPQWIDDILTVNGRNLYAQMLLR